MSRIVWSDPLGFLSDWHDIAGTKTKEKVALLMYYKSWRCHHNDNLTKILTKMAFIILIFESDIRIKYRL